MSRPSPERRKVVVEEKRALILDAALRVFAERGFHATGIADIAAQLGMGHGTFYRYFDNKLDIFAALLDEIAFEVRRLVETEPAGAPSLDAYREQLERITARLFLIFTGRPARARLLFYEAWAAGPEMRAKVLAMVDDFAALTESYVRHGVREGYLRESLDPEVTSRLLNALLFEGMRSVVLADNPLEVGLRYTRVGIDFLLFGIARR